MPELRIESDGKDCANRVRRTLGDIVDESDRVVRVAVTLEYEDTSSHSSVDHPQIREGTNQHIALSVLERYLDEKQVEKAPARELSKQPGHSLTVDQIGSALNTLHHSKGIVEAKKTSLEGNRAVNHYSLTPTAARELDRIGRAPIQ